MGRMHATFNCKRYRSVSCLDFHAREKLQTILLAMRLVLVLLPTFLLFVFVLILKMLHFALALFFGFRIPCFSCSGLVISSHAFRLPLLSIFSMLSAQSCKRENSCALNWPC